MLIYNCKENKRNEVNKMRPSQRRAFLRNHPEHADWYYEYESLVAEYDQTFEQCDKDDQLLADGTINHDEFIKHCKAVCKLQAKLISKMNSLDEKMIDAW